jgi:magnesium transporter
VLETVHREVEAMEDKVFAAPLPSEEVQRLYILRRELLQLRNAAAPLSDRLSQGCSVQTSEARPS